MKVFLTKRDGGKMAEWGADGAGHGCNPQGRNGATREQQTGIAWIFFAFLRISTKKGVPLQMKRAMGVVVPSLDCIFHLPMTNENPSTAQNETFTWLQPGAWRKPCIVHVTMVANSRQAEAKHYAYVGIPVESQRYRFVALNEMGRMLVAQ